MGFSPPRFVPQRLKPRNSKALKAALKRCSIQKSKSTAKIKTQTENPQAEIKNPMSRARYRWHVEQLVMSVTVRNLYFFTKSVPRES